MLPLCFGEATKIAGWLLGANKAYEAVAKFGVVTDSADADGQIVGRYPLPLISDADLQRAFVTLDRQNSTGAPHLFRSEARRRAFDMPKRDVVKS
jgi:hypothetical protein